MSTPANRRTRLVRRLLLAAWGMVTVTLFFCVVLLVGVLVRDEAAAPAPAKPLAAASDALPPAMDEHGSTREVTLYFADASGRRLAPETRRLEYSERSTTENCHQALDALIRGPRDVLRPVVPPGAAVRGLYLRQDGELVVDFSINLEADSVRLKSAAFESLMLYGIVNTLSDPALKGSAEPAVARVRILIDGSAPRDTFPAHLDASVPFTADRQWLEPMEQP